ncbi:putative lipid II flippase FtsW [Fredinandcohnia quinoae]|uniref:Probable peptidoglycan glycosyltransferase FtsW n=1 Tax=Fredinandcohnia quinoae TaxID=2918902 RepID=A0AAW5DX76_9BACI|nr:putative lipid II flippase FtsW [Fredinandcohnia sp. SECRCQ15]MCH1623924.1 putative lipid II flippase FtsW [Fredinandcohnia sp. SECRCQ15]
MLKKIIKSYDYTLIVPIFLLCLLGLIMVYSSSMVIASSPKFGDPAFFYERQKISLIVGTLAFIVAMIFPYKIYASSKVLLAIVFGSIGMLLLVFGFGHSANNAQSWLNLGARGIQPSEFTKLSVIIYLAAVYSKKQSYINRFKEAVLPPILFTMTICIFVAIQPDFGTAFIIGLIAIFIILCSGMNMKTIMKLVLLVLITAAILLPVIMIKSDEIFSDERMGRFAGFLDPFGEEEDHGHQLVNSYISLGAGGLTGLGLGKSIQKTGYLPEAHTDFIMAIIAEELGLIGVIFVLICLTFIVLRGFQIARKCSDPFGSLLAIGISSMVAIQTFINLGGLTGLIPITGVTLPFISYGGSSLLVLLLSMGILLNVSMFTNYHANYSNKEQKPQKQNIHQFTRKHASFK